MITIAIRRRVSPRRDRRIFSKTASKTKVINLTPTVYRGGVRL